MMSGLNLNNLKNYKNDILKAEIAALLFNLGKTHIGFWKEKNGKIYFNVDENNFKQNYGYSLFTGYKKYYEENHFENELHNIDIKLKDFVLNEKVTLPDLSKIDWKEFFYGDVSKENFIKKIFFRGCENINSGIDKGSPKDENQLKGKLCLSNAFGSFKIEIKEDDFDKARLCFLQRLGNYLEDNRYYSNPDWKEINQWIKNEIKSWYSRLLSDSRFPINDVSLWDQAYMTASMFKATLAGLYLDNSNYQEFLKNPQNIKWSILGIQYDKLGLAEKGLKPGFIAWYRETSRDVDEKIKELLETEYPIGNEVYRDETGIYFIVAENLIGEASDEFYKLSSSLDEIKEKIIEIFEHFQGEVYPAILLTKPSRGLMNLGHLIEKAKENFLKAEKHPNNPTLEKIIIKDKEYYVNPEKKYLNNKSQKPNYAIGICPVCKTRLILKSDAERKIKPTTCEICDNRVHHHQVAKWLDNLQGETIWTGELQDKKGRIALVTMKFELNKWLNGDLLNGLVVNNDDYASLFDQMKDTVEYIKFLYYKNAFSIESYKKDNNLDERFLIELERRSNNIFSFNRKIGKLNLIVNTEEEKVELTDKNGNKQNTKNLLSNEVFKKLIKLFDFKIFNLLAKDAYNGCKKNNETFDDYINQIFFGSIVGTEWETLIKETTLNRKIKWDDNRIIWQNLNDSDVEFLSQLILQFLLRKNPSPARLRRIWETTREFFEDIAANIESIVEVPEWRKQRVIFEFEISSSNNNSFKDDAEYTYNGLQFWKKGNHLYLIDSIERFLKTFFHDELQKIYNGKIVNIDNNELELLFKNKTFEITQYNDSSVKVTIKITSLKLETYKPILSIIDPTPISWQFAMPADRVPILLKRIKEEYNKHFRYVYGKLPLHVGIVVQDYKKPLYVGIKALRKIRRDNTKWDDLKEEVSTKYLKAKQKEVFYYVHGEEQINNAEDFYSFYEFKDKSGKYEFFIYPEKNGKRKIDTTQNTTDTDIVFYYPNTFDFEFLDTNTRRNDIYYKKAKRFMKLKSNRPYDLDGFQYFENFKKFFKDKKSSSNLQKIISIIYSKLEDWNIDIKNPNNEKADSFIKFINSAFINVLELNVGAIHELPQNELPFYELPKNINQNHLSQIIKIIDMFEFWHTMLKADRENN